MTKYRNELKIGVSYKTKSNTKVTIFDYDSTNKVFTGIYIDHNSKSVKNITFNRNGVHNNDKSSIMNIVSEWNKKQR